VREALDKQQHRGAIPTYLVPGAVVEINVYGQSKKRKTTPQAQVRLTIPYPDQDQDGYVDGMQMHIKEENLSVYWLNEETETFVKLPGSVVNPVANSVSVVLPHLSVFTLMGVPSTSLGGAHAYPVPYISSRGDTVITFTDLSGIATIDIYTTNGEMVTTLNESDGDGQLIWDTRRSYYRLFKYTVIIRIFPDGNNRQTIPASSLSRVIP